MTLPVPPPESVERGPGDSPAEPAAGSRSGTRGALVAVAIVVLAGLVWGIVWWRLAPTARTTVSDGAIYLNGHDELNVAQDGWFAVLGAITGGLFAVVIPVLLRARPLVGFVVGLLGCVAAGLLALALGGWLGPDGLKAQYQAGIKAPITPIQLHTPLVVMLIIAPMIFAAVRFVAELLTAVLGGRNPAVDGTPHATGPWAGPDVGAGSAAQGVHVQQGQ